MSKHTFGGSLAHQQMRTICCTAHSENPCGVNESACESSSMSAL